MEKNNAELNGFVVILLIISIFRNFIRVFSAIIALQIYTDVYVILEIILSILVIFASIGILLKNRLALIGLFVFGAGNAAIAFWNGNTEAGIVQLFILGLWAAIFCLRKNGTSVWKAVLYDKRFSEDGDMEEKGNNFSFQTQPETESELLRRSYVEENTNKSYGSSPDTNKEFTTEIDPIGGNEDNARLSEVPNTLIFSKNKQSFLINNINWKISLGIFITAIILIGGFIFKGQYSSKTPEDQFDEAKRMFEEHKTDEAIQLFTDLANNGFVKAKTALGVIYLMKKEVKLDASKGFHYLEDAAKNDTSAIRLLIKIYSGKECKGEKFANDIKLKEYAELAIKKGCEIGEAYFALGNICARQEKYSNAFYYWQKATEYNVLSAHRNIGILFYHGWGCPVNYEKARNHLLLAKNKKNDDSLVLLYLGMMCKYGLGIPHDWSVAKDYLKKSADLGNESAQKEYAEMEMQY